MPKVTAVTVAVTALILIALTGCAAGSEDAGNESPAPVVSESVAPSAVPTPSKTPESAITAPAPRTPEEEAYLSVTLPDLSGWGTVLTEQEALDAARYACEQIAALPAGHTIIDRYKIQPLPGDTEAANSVIVREAITHFCP